MIVQNYICLERTEVEIIEGNGKCCRFSAGILILTLYRTLTKILGKSKFQQRVLLEDI